MPAVNANLSNTQQLEAYIPIPPGDYLVTIIDSQVRETRAGGPQVVFIYEVRGGDHSGEQVYDRLALWSANPKTVNFAQRRLKSIAIAAGHKNPNFVADTSEFHGLSMIIRTALREYEGQQYVDIKSYSPANQAVPQAAAPVQAMPAQAMPGAMPPPPTPVQQAPMQKPWE